MLQLIEDFINGTLVHRRGGSGAEVTQETVTVIWSLAVSIFCVGGMMGGSMVGFVANKYGRKGGLLLNNIFVFASAFLQGI